MLDILAPLAFLLFCCWLVISTASPWIAMLAVVGAMGAISWLSDELSYYLRRHFNDWDHHDTN